MIRRHLTYANVASTLALVLASGTGAVYAAGEIGSKDLKNNSVRSKDLKDRQSVAGRDVRRNTLGSREIDEASLVGSRIVDLKGNQAVDCDPADAVFADCVSQQVALAVLPTDVVNAADRRPVTERAVRASPVVVAKEGCQGLRPVG